MRLDLYLWYARAARSRAAAQAIAGSGHLRLNGRAIDRPAAPVRVGDVLTFAGHGSVRVLRVVALPGRRGPPAEARLAYEELSVPSMTDAGKMPVIDGA